MSAATHIVWDWNGTLLDDTGAALGALNAMLARRGIAAVSMESYRARFRFPARQYYEEIGMPVPDAEWDAIAQEYHDSYDVESASAALNVEAVAALELARSRGARQSILSALRQDLLEEAVERFGVGGYFDFVRGTDNLYGAGKLAFALALKAEIESSSSPPPRIVMIGDAIHDCEVATELGVECVLCAQGSHSFERLAALGVPTAPSLVAAVSLVFETQTTTPGG